jgi:hypothetical protein
MMTAATAALASPPPERASSAIDVGESLSSSHRGVSQDYLVLPDGAELTGQMRFLTSEAFLQDHGDAKPLAFTDLALFGMTVRKSLFSKLEVSASVELLPKQPAFTSEKAWQSVAVGVRSPIGNTGAVSLGGAGGHLLSSDGSWVRQTLALELRKPIHEIMTFDVHGGVDTTVLVRDAHEGGWVTELGVSAQALFRDPHGAVGGWVGMGYAIPVSSRGFDPTSDLALDPRARLDFRIGGVISLVDNWDLFAELAVVDRGELTNPATRLPILDGGFDQRQAMFGVTRHISGGKDRRGDYDHDDDGYRLSQR